jgi:hypothetical protein
MREIIIDIDNSESVQAAVSRVSGGWYAPVEMYADLKANGKTNSPNFWGIATQMLTDVSGFLGWTSAQFMNEWDRRCIGNNTKFMGYHCTRHSDERVFIEKGVLPLPEDTIRLSEDKGQTALGKNMWEYRTQRSPGPCFLLSYKCAKSPENHFCLKGPEILLACAGHHVDVDPAKSVPLIIHCAIPYSALSEKDYFAFCVLRAYFNFLDPEDDLNNLFDGYSIDLKGKGLDPRHIVRVEKI